MNLYLRLLGVLLRSLFLPRQDPLGVNRLPLWVKPWDCDLNGHMNNGRYLTVMDLGRLDLMGRAKLLGPLLRQRWVPLVAASDLHFSGSLRPFERYVLETRVLSWDERWFYLEQRFVVRDAVRARGWIKGTFFRGRHAIPPADVLRLAGVEAAAPDLPEPVARWAALHTTRAAR